jgi:hypothetical protein
MIGDSLFWRVPVNSLQEAADDSYHYYMIGFYLDNKTQAGWHPISVRMQGPRTELTYVVTTVNTKSRSRRMGRPVRGFNPLPLATPPVLARRELD